MKNVIVEIFFNECKTFEYYWWKWSQFLQQFLRCLQLWCLQLNHLLVFRYPELGHYGFIVGVHNLSNQLTSKKNHKSATDCIMKFKLGMLGYSEKYLEPTSQMVSDLWPHVGEYFPNIFETGCLSLLLCIWELIRIPQYSNIYAGNIMSRLHTQWNFQK